MSQKDSPQGELSCKWPLEVSGKPAVAVSWLQSTKIGIALVVKYGGENL
jgi:hypothetical protein